MIKILKKFHDKPILRVKQRGLYEAATLAAGGRAERICEQGLRIVLFQEYTIAIERIRSKSRHVLVIDIDLNYRDETTRIFRGDIR